MSVEERKTYFETAQILYNTKLPNLIEDAIEYVNRGVKINSNLNDEERHLLKIAYKKVIDITKQKILKINHILENDNCSPLLTQKLNEIKQNQMNFRLKYSKMLIDLIDNVIKPTDSNAENLIYFQTLKGDHYRYICEMYSEDSKERKEYMEIAKYVYIDTITTVKISTYYPIYLGLILNYTVLLANIIGNKKEAITISKKFFDECSPLIDNNTEKGRIEAERILKTIDSNIKLWESQLSNQNK